jgi:hypothetical protein
MALKEGPELAGEDAMMAVGQGIRGQVSILDPTVHCGYRYVAVLGHVARRQDRLHVGSSPSGPTPQQADDLGVLAVSGITANLILSLLPTDYTMGGIIVAQRTRKVGVKNA